MRAMTLYTATKSAVTQLNDSASTPNANGAVGSGTLFHPWRIDGGWPRSLNVSSLRRKGQPSILESGADTNMGRTMPNRHLRSGDRPAPNEIEFEGLAQGVGIKSCSVRFIKMIGQSRRRIEQQHWRGIAWRHSTTGSASHVPVDAVPRRAAGECWLAHWRSGVLTGRRCNLLSKRVAPNWHVPGVACAPKAF